MQCLRRIPFAAGLRLASCIGYDAGKCETHCSVCGMRRGLCSLRYAEKNLMPLESRPEPKTANRRRSHSRRIVSGVLCLAGVLLGGLAWYRAIAVDPGVIFLMPEQGAQWIRVAEPYSLGGFARTVEVGEFIFVTEVRDTPSVPPVLTVRALTDCEVFWDDRLLYRSEDNSRRWKEPLILRLGGIVRPGVHQLRIVVRHVRGRAALLAYCPELGISTNETWRARYQLETWAPPRLVTVAKLPPLSEQFPSPAQAWREILPGFAPGAIVITCLVGWVLWPLRQKVGEQVLSAPPESGNWRETFFSPRVWRWIAWIAWLVLAMNNFRKVPENLGYDLAGHRAYIQFLLEKGRLPLATDGPQMFQSPLYYLISAPVYFLLTTWGCEPEVAWQWLRWIPLLCCAGLVELCYRAGRIAFPDRSDLQTWTLLFGGWLPMSLYMAPALSNEPLCALLSAAVWLMCFRGLKEPGGLVLPRRQWALGIALGLALLTKATAILLIPAVVLCLWTALSGEQRGGAGKALLRCGTAATLLAGWFYFRNWWYFNQFIVGGWDAVTRIEWWQDPAYRTPQQMATFGAALVHPIHAGFYSIWDGCFATFWLDGNLSSLGTWEERPPWNYSWMLAAAWPGLLWTFVMGLGAVRCVRESFRNSCGESWLILGTVGLYLAAFAWLCLHVPIYSQAKGSYLLGLAPVFAVLCVQGLALFPRRWLVQTGIWATLLCWCVLVYAAYFVR